ILTDRAKQLNPPWEKSWNRSGIAELLDFLETGGIPIEGLALAQEEEQESKAITRSETVPLNLSSKSVKELWPIAKNMGWLTVNPNNPSPIGIKKEVFVKFIETQQNKKLLPISEEEETENVRRTQS